MTATPFPTALSMDDVSEALEGADMVILAVGENCARRYLRKHPPSTKTKSGKGKSAKAQSLLSRDEVLRGALAAMMTPSLEAATEPIYPFSVVPIAEAGSMRRSG